MTTTIHRSTRLAARCAIALLAALLLGCAVAQNEQNAGPSSDALGIDEIRSELERIQSELGTLIDQLERAEGSSVQAGLDAVTQQMRRSELRTARQALTEIGERVRTGEDVEGATQRAQRVRADVTAAYSAGRTSIPEEVAAPLDDYVQALQAIEPGALDEEAQTELDAQLQTVIDALDTSVAAEDRASAYRSAGERLRALEGQIDSDPEAAAQEVESIRLALQRSIASQPGGMSEADEQFDLTLGRLTQNLTEGRAEAYEDTYGEAVDQIAAMEATSQDGATSQESQDASRDGAENEMSGESGEDATAQESTDQAAPAGGDLATALQDAERRLRDIEGRLESDPEAAAQEIDAIRSSVQQASGGEMSAEVEEFDLTLGRLTQNLREGRAEEYESSYGEAVDRVTDLRESMGGSGD